MSPRASKYNAVRTNGYASKAEADYAAGLHILEKAGKIRNLEEQVRFLLLPADPAKGYKRPLTYIADFVFEEDHGEAWGNQRWRQHIQDKKGFRTKEYIIKKRMMLQILGYNVEEV